MSRLAAKDYTLSTSTIGVGNTYSSVVDATKSKSLSVQIALTVTSAVSDATVGLQKSNDYNPILGTGTFVEETTASFTASGTIFIKQVDPEYKHFRIHYYISAGSATAVAKVILKEDV